jgi:hypothetical protein
MGLLQALRDECPTTDDHAEMVRQLRTAPLVFVRVVGGEGYTPEFAPVAGEGVSPNFGSCFHGMDPSDQTHLARWLVEAARDPQPQLLPRKRLRADGLRVPSAKTFALRAFLTNVRTLACTGPQMRLRYRRGRKRRRTCQSTSSDSADVPESHDVSESLEP